MTCVDWNKILHEIPVTSANHNNDDSIMRTTLEIHDSLHRTISKLSDRMHAFISIGNFEWALNDAAALRTLDPSFSDAYICAAEIYHQQGDKQAATDICNEGLRMIHSSDPAYATLQSMVIKNELPVQTPVDFISLLPMNITSRIACMLFTKGHPTKDANQYPCLTVSKAWHKRLMESYNAQELHVVNSNTFDNWDSHIRQHGYYMTSLTIDHCTWPSYQLLEKTTFASLTTLVIKDTSQDEDTYMWTRLLRALQHMPTTLTTLTIIAPTMLPIASILNALPNLSSLECSSIAIDPIMLDSSYPRMKTFKLHCPKYADYEAASCVLPRFPFLHTLLFDAITDRFSKILAQLPHWCPRLQHINLGSEHTTMHPITPGGVTIILAMKRTSFCSSAIITFLEHYAAQLENMVFQLSLGDFPKHFIIPVQFKRLKYMEIAYGDTPDTSERLCEWMIRHAPFLESIHVCSAWSAGMSVFNAMIALARLRVAELPFSLDTIKGQDWFLKHHHTLGTKSSLRSLIIQFVGGTSITGHTLQKVAGLKHLEELSIVEEDHDGGVFQQLAPRLMFESLIRGCTSLTHLTLNAFTWIDQAVIEAVARSKSLKHLTLMVDDVSYTAIYPLFSCTQLKTLHLSTDKLPIPASDPGVQGEKMLQLVFSKRASR